MYIEVVIITGFTVFHYDVTVLFDCVLNFYSPHPDAVLSRTQNAKITDIKSSSTGQEMTSNRPQTAGTRPISASTRPLSGREILMPTSDLPEEMPKSLHPSDNDVVDWRGKVTPDSSRYKLV